MCTGGLHTWRFRRGTAPSPGSCGCTAYTVVSKSRVANHGTMGLTLSRNLTLAAERVPGCPIQTFSTYGTPQYRWTCTDRWSLLLHRPRPRETGQAPGESRGRDGRKEKRMHATIRPSPSCLALGRDAAQTSIFGSICRPTHTCSSLPALAPESAIQTNILPPTDHTHHHTTTTPSCPVSLFFLIAGSLGFGQLTQSRPRLLFCLVGATWRHTSDGDASCWVLGRQVQDIQTHTGTDAPRPRLSKSRDTYVHALGLPASSPARRQPESGFFVTSHFPISHNYPCFSCKPPRPAPHPSRLPLVLVHVWPISISFFEATRLCPTRPLVSCVGGLPTTQYAEEGTLQNFTDTDRALWRLSGGQPGDLLLF